QGTTPLIESMRYRHFALQSVEDESEFFVLDERIAGEPEHLREIGRQGNRLQVGVEGRVHPGRLAVGLGCGGPDGIPAGGSAPGESYTGLNLYPCVRIVLQFAPDGEPEGIGRADLVLYKPTVQI